MIGDQNTGFHPNTVESSSELEESILSQGDIARFGFCSEAEKVLHELEKHDVGSDDQYGEVTILRCTRCGRCWLHYLIEYEYLTASGRWCEGEISPQVATFSHQMTLFSCLIAWNGSIALAALLVAS